MYRLNQIIHSYVPLGMVVWLLTWFLPLYDHTERIILFAALVVVPLTIYRVLESTVHMPVVFMKVLIYLLPSAAIALLFSFGLTPGFFAGVLAIPWSLVTFIIAIQGFLYLMKAFESLANISKALGFMYISIGGIWLVAHQFAVPLLGFEGQIMLLTVNHFHYAGFVAPILFAFLHERLQKNKLATSLIIILGGIAPILIALGMTYSPMIEWLSVITFASSLILYSLLVFLYVIPVVMRWTKVLHILSSSVIWITMALAVTYGFGQWTNQPTISISTMIVFHGWGNAILFSFIGLLAWHATIMDRDAAKIPFSNLQGNGKIGANVFEKLEVLDNRSGHQPTGLIDRMLEYRSDSFEPMRLHSDVVNFYEHTDAYELLLNPHWSRLFHLPSQIYKRISQRIEQMNFPLTAETDEQQIQSVILPIKDEKDGRDNVRAWVRTYNQTQKAIYAALYSTHVSAGTRYMNIAFPLPFSQMTSVLHLQQDANERLVLTSWPGEQTTGDQGVYLVLNGQAIRLPINETITVWKESGSPTGTIEATHDMWLFGMKFLTLDYHIFKV